MCLDLRVSMCAYMYTRLYKCVCLHECKHVYIYLRVFMNVCTLSSYVPVYVILYAPQGTYAGMYVCHLLVAPSKSMDVCMYIRMYVRYVCMHNAYRYVMYLNVCMDVYMCVNVSIYYVTMHVCMHVNMQKYEYVNM